jgi:hypothetical protein
MALNVGLEKSIDYSYYWKGIREKVAEVSTKGYGKNYETSF